VDRSIDSGDPGRSRSIPIDPDRSTTVDLLIGEDMADQPKQINFTIVPDEPAQGPGSRTYSNFCSIAHTPFDFTLTFCEVMPLSDKEIKEAETDHVVRAPVRAKVVVPVQFVPNLITALQEHWRVFSESYSNVAWNKGTGPVH
jgi:hypothetical protein